MRNIVNLLRGITRPGITWLLVGTVCGLAISGQVIPDDIKVMTSTAIGFWFAAHTLAQDG